MKHAPVPTSIPSPAAAVALDTEFTRGLGLFDSTMVVVGSMIGSGGSRGDSGARGDLPGCRRPRHGRGNHDLDLRMQQRSHPGGSARLLRHGQGRGVLPVGRWGLAVQAVWASALVLPRTYDPGRHSYGNLYGDLLTYVISAGLIFYILTIAGVFRLRVTRPDLERPYRAFGYPVVPAIYIAGAGTILLVLLIYQPSTTWPGLVLVILGLPVYRLWRGPRSPSRL